VRAAGRERGQFAYTMGLGMLTRVPFRSRRRTQFLWVVSCVFGLLPGGTALADSSGVSGISSFRADVTVREDSTLEVREEIVARDAAAFYKHGFRHDLPISPLDRWDVKYVGTYKPDNGVRFKILEVTEDSAPARAASRTAATRMRGFHRRADVPLDSRAPLRRSLQGGTRADFWHG
jgi:hypothetical protein